MMRQTATILAVLATIGSAVRAETTAEFALAGSVQANVAWGAEFAVTVAVTHHERMAACAYRLEFSGAAGVRMVQRAVNPALQYLGTDAESPLADALPILLGGGDAVAEVLLNIASADPPGNPLDGLAPGANVSVAVYTFVATQPGSLVVTLSSARAAETQSDPNGAHFDVTTIAPASAQIEISITGGPDLNADGHVDLRDFARLQACMHESPAGICASADVDGDGDVDLLDYQVVQECLAGPAQGFNCDS